MKSVEKKRINIAFAVSDLNFQKLFEYVVYKLTLQLENK